MRISASQRIEQVNGLSQTLVTKPGRNAIIRIFFGSLESQAVENPPCC